MKKSSPRKFYKWNLSFHRKNAGQKVLVLLAFLYWHFTWSTLHTTALTLHMSPICHNLFTISLRCPKVYVWLLTTSVSASHCAEGKHDHCAHFSKGWFLQTDSTRICEGSDRNKSVLHMEIAVSHRAVTHTSHSSPNLQDLRPSSCQTKLGNKISHTVIQFKL